MVTVISTPQAKVKPYNLHKRFQFNNKDSYNENTEFYELDMSTYNVKLLSLKIYIVEN